MNASLLSIIKRIVTEQGEAILADPQRLKGFFKQYAHDEPKDQCLTFVRCIEQGCYGELKKTRSADERRQAKARLAEQVQRRSELDFRLCADALDLLEAVMFGTAPQTPVPGQDIPPVTGQGYQTLSTNRQKSIVALERRKAMNAILLKIRVYIDGQLIVQLKNGESTSFEVNNGKHFIYCEAFG